uniref:hypothetical protein n=1 Tax=uncultured Anaerococcus sp. TaxID=293428 RepID=UPI00288A6701
TQTPGTDQADASTQTPGTDQADDSTQTPGINQPGLGGSKLEYPAPKAPEHKNQEEKVNDNYQYYLSEYGTTNIKAHDRIRKDYSDIYRRLREAYERISNTERAARFLLKNFPETVKPVKTELEALVEKSYNLRLQAKEKLDKFEASMANR